MTTLARPESHIDFTDPAINRDPYPYLDQIRELAPAVWNPPSNAWLVTSFDNVRMLFSRFADFAQAETMYLDVFGGTTLVGADNPRHNELRSVWGPYLTRRAVEDYADLARRVADEQLAPALERLRAGETVEIGEYLRQIPTHTIATLLGVPREDGDRFVQWAQRMVSVFDVYDAPGEDAAAKRAEGLAAAKELYDYSGEALELRRRFPGSDDLLSALATTDVEISEEEMRAYVTMMIFASQDTTTAFQKVAVAALAQHPDQRRAVAEDRTLMPKALDEVIRWQCPVTGDVRLVRHGNVQIGGISIPEGDYVTPVVGAANRDPARWENPGTFDIFRPERGNVGFGFGIHSCLGVNLARMVVTTTMNKILDEIPEYQLAVPADELEYGHSFLIRSAEVLPLTI
jgi:cytochrome P450